MQYKKCELTSWSRYPAQNCTLYRPERYSGFHPVGSSSIARGAGLSYGDAALNENGNVVLSERINRILRFDEKIGVITAEAGVTLEEILNVIIPKRWFLPVTPGTQYITLGGAVAADVHGKNHHHDGAFSQFIEKLEVVTPVGRMNCSAEENGALFWATVGGMGLTGFISEVTIKLRPIETAYMSVKHFGAENLTQLFECFSDESLDDQYSVAWIDCLASGNELGRGVFMSAHHARINELEEKNKQSPLTCDDRKPSAIPFDFPGWALNSLTVKALNSFYYKKNSSKDSPFISNYKEYFYPLDGVNNWNRMYGKKGFVQYQCVIPEEKAAEGIRKILETISSSKQSSFLAVLKKMGPENKGFLSFPMAGYTLALDLTINNERIFEILNQLDEMVVSYGGRVYLAKDARLNEKSFLSMYPDYPKWKKIKNQFDPDNLISSSLARRLGIMGTGEKK